MFKRFITVLTVVALLFSVMSVGLTANAAYTEEILYGDVDGDGVVDTKDARKALEIASGLAALEDDAQLLRSDVNFDGYVTIFDARQILRGAAGLATLQPSGAFGGFDGGGVFGNEESLVNLFNTALNRVKNGDNKTILVTNTKIESDNLTSFNIKEVELPVFGNATAEGIASMVEESLVEEDEDNTVTVIASGSSNYDDFAVEGEDFVSNLTVSDVFGSRASYSNENNQALLTIEIALPDTEIEMAGQSAYAKVLNTSQIIQEQNTTLMSLMKASSGETAMLREFKNCVLTLVVDITGENLEVVSYTISYQSKVYVAQTTVGLSSANVLKATLKGIEYEKDHVVMYEDFQWL